MAHIAPVINPKFMVPKKLQDGLNIPATFTRPVLVSLLPNCLLMTVRARAARYPNTGWLNVTTVNNQTKFTSTGIVSQSTDYYKGAILLMRPNQYRLESRQITASTGQSLTFNAASDYSLVNGRTFLLINKLEFLDEAGEWYYDNATNTVYLWTLNGDSPSNYEIRGSVNDNGVVMENKSYVTVKNLNILQQKINGINGVDPTTSNITIDNNDISDVESIGINIRGAKNVIRNNKISGANAIGIKNVAGIDGIIEDNQILNTAMFENLGTGGMLGQGTSMAISTTGNAQTIRYNRIINTAYVGIRFQGLNTLVENNFVDNVCTMLFDGSAIYTYASSLTDIQSAGSIVKNNIVVYPNGSAGIAMDNFTQGVLIEGNTIAYGTGSRYYAPNTFCIAVGLNDNKNIKVRNNVVFSNTKGLRILKGYTGNEFTGNIVCNIPTTPNNPYGFAPLLTEQRDIRETVKWDYNIYIDRTRPRALRRQQSGIYDYYNFTDWKLLTGQDANSTFIGTALAEGETEELFYNDTKQNKTFNLGSSVYKDIYGKQVAQSLVLEPFTSIILIKTNPVVAVDNIPPTINSFSIPATSASCTVPVSSFTASDKISVTGFKLTESATAPQAGDAGWSATAPNSYCFASEGTKTLCAWAKDAAGNVSAGVSQQVNITLKTYKYKYK